MSYQQFQQECGDCHKRWNAAFGIVGTTQIAAPPTKCPHCGSGNLIKIADRWADRQTLSVTAYCLERNADLEAQNELSGQAYLVVVNELRKTQAERDRALSELCKALEQHKSELAEARKAMNALRRAASWMRREWAAFGALAGETVEQMDRAIDAARAAIPADALASGEGLPTDAVPPQGGRD